MIIKAIIEEHSDEAHLLKVSYESKSWIGNGTLCDDGWEDREADIICKQNGFLVSFSNLAIYYICKLKKYFLPKIADDSKHYSSENYLSKCPYI